MSADKRALLRMILHMLAEAEEQQLPVAVACLEKAAVSVWQTIKPYASEPGYGDVAEAMGQLDRASLTEKGD